MSKKWLILDCNFLCHRAYHAMGHLAGAEENTGVVYGFLKDVAAFYLKFKPVAGFVFCWDLGRSDRGRILPEYKIKRQEAKQELDDEEKAAKAEMRRQCRLLRVDYLPRLGFKNIWYERGFESDDFIAMAARVVPKSTEAIMITSDKDMYQCISRNAFFYNPNSDTLLTRKDLAEIHGVTPGQWASVKAIGGCASDEVPGVPKVGEKTAIKYIRGELPEHHKTYQAIQNSSAIIERNLKLVTLPYPGTPELTPEPEEPDEEKWKALTEELGMPSIKEIFHKERKRGEKRKGFTI